MGLSVQFQASLKAGWVY